MASFAQINAALNALNEGRYALPAKNGSDEVYFFEISKVKDSHRIFRLLGAPGDFTKKTMKFAWQVAAVQKISVNPVEAMTFFGKKTRQCGACGSELTHVRSRACGMGPKCAPAHGVKW